ncbi:MAG: APC family permease [Coriobacteriia bacterium]|nr:APC family permease [Coriobacteriia bacterium]
MLHWIRRLLIGDPIPSSRALHERLSKFVALPVFGSDPISSVAYATEEILLGLILIGPLLITHSNALIYIAVAIVTLMTIVATSYRQTIFSYPSGGGAYIVAKDNLGTTPGLYAGAALMIDYVLTVAVSVCSGVAAVLSFLPDFQHLHVEIAVLAVVFIALANLRGVRESGALFALPTYVFVGSALALVAMGGYRIFTHPGFSVPTPPGGTIPEPTHLGASGLLLGFLILRAFASGCAAMTGTEAVSNGIPAFRPPESKNAATTLVIMISLLATLFIGISFVAWKGHVIPMEQTAPGYQTVPSQIAAAVFGRNWFYYLFQGATAAILMLAANTSFADFPRLGSIMARDRFLPRQLYNLGDKLVYSNGIVMLSLLAIALIVAFRGVVNALIPLYAIGVFLSFTLSQAGMVKHFKRFKERGWRRGAIISGIGATATAIVCVVQAVTKACEGAWIVLILIPSLVLLFSRIHKHYITLGNELRLTPEDQFVPMNNTTLVLTPSLHKGVLPALEYAQTQSSQVRAIHVETDPLDTELLIDRWDKWSGGIPLIILESPYRSLVGPLMEYLDEVREENGNQIVTVVIPEFVIGKWWHRFLHNQSGLMLKFALLFKEGVVTTNIRYHVARRMNGRRRVPVNQTRPTREPRS